MLLPVFAYIAVMYLYKFSGKKKFLHFDLIQFIYAFVGFPLVYIWLKNFIFFLLRNELGITLSISNWMMLDTFFSVIFLYFYAFGIIHSLTKSFALEMERDPLFDLFTQSEYFHEFLSHVGMYLAGIYVVCILGFINSIFPAPLGENRIFFYSILFVGLLAGVLLYVGLFIMTDIENKKYKRLMQFNISLMFMVHVIFYFLVSPNYSIKYVVYWFTFTIFMSGTVSLFVLNSNKKLVHFVERKFKPVQKNLQDGVIEDEWNQMTNFS